MITMPPGMIEDIDSCPHVLLESLTGSTRRLNLYVGTHRMLRHVAYPKPHLTVGWQSQPATIIIITATS